MMLASWYAKVRPQKTRKGKKEGEWMISGLAQSHPRRIEVWTTKGRSPSKGVKIDFPALR